MKTNCKDKNKKNYKKILFFPKKREKKFDKFVYISSKNPVISST